MIPRDMAADAIRSLDCDARWQDIMDCISRTAAQTVPERVLKRAVEVFASESKAVRWLLCGNRDIGGMAPIELLPGNEEGVLAHLGLIEDGVYH